MNIFNSHQESAESQVDNQTVDNPWPKFPFKKLAYFGGLNLVTDRYPISIWIFSREQLILVPFRLAWQQMW